MQKPSPSGRNQNSIRGVEPSRDSSSATVSRDPPMTTRVKPTRKSSAEINRTVNAFVQQSNKMAINGFPKRNDSTEKSDNLTRQAKPINPVGTKTTPKQIVEMQGGYFRSRQPPSANTKVTGTNVKKTTVSFTKDAESGSGMLRRSDMNSAGDFPTKKPSGVQKGSQKEVRIAGSGVPRGNSACSDANNSTRQVASTHRAIDETIHRNTSTKFTVNKAAVAQENYKATGVENQALAKANLPNATTKTVGHTRKSSARKLDYYTTSSSDDECTRPPKGPDAPLSPASKAKMWNDINKSPGPTYPGWKFRSPPEGRHLSQIGPEELSATFKNMKMEAQAKTEVATSKGPSKFSDYMRKMKTSSRVAEEMSETSLKQNLELKKMYAEQLDAMQQRAWESLQALDANLKRTSQTELRTGFEKFMEGTSRVPNRITVEEMAKSRAANFKAKDNPSQKQLRKSFAHGDVVQADELSSDESDMMSPPSPRRAGGSSPRGAKNVSSTKPTARMEQMLADIRSTRRNLAQGDVLQLRDSDAVSSHDSDKASNPSPRPSRFGGNARSGAQANKKPPPDETRSLSRVTADQFKSLAEEDPLKKLKKISDQLKLDNARMLSRRAPHTQAIRFSSSEDESDDFDVPIVH